MQLPEFSSVKEYFQTLLGLLEIGQFPGTVATDLVVARAHTQRNLQFLEAQEKNEQAAAEEASKVQSSGGKKKPKRR